MWAARGATTTGWRPVRSGFTLIELLVVIAVIAVLIGVLLPALARARDASRIVKCRSNIRQVTMASILYANDCKDQLWDSGQYSMDPIWYHETPNRRPPYGKGIIFEYFGGDDSVAECPVTKRRASDWQDGWGPPRYAFNPSRDLITDYTVLDETRGAKLSTQFFCGWVNPPAPMTTRLSSTQAGTLHMFRSLPLFIEESNRFHNSWHDMMWGNTNQIVQIHTKGGHISYLDGSSDLFRQVDGGRGADVEEAGDFTANCVYVSVKGSPTSWYKVSDLGQPYGWINNPR